MTPPEHTTSKPTVAAVLVVFLLTSAAFVAFSLFPAGRSWGLSVWAHFPVWLPATMAVALLLTAGLALRLGAAELKSGRKTCTVSTLAVSGVLLLAFVLLRTKTHYMGDGYALLDHLASDQPLIKNRQWLESWVRVIVRDLAGGPSADNALLSFRILAWIGGATFVAVAAIWSRILIRQPFPALLLFGGIVTGGYTLMFFGYVENYSLFVPAVLLFTLYGLAAAQEKHHPGWGLVMIVPAVLLHIFGVTLLPAAIYLVLSHPAIANRLLKLPAALRWGGVLIAVVGLLGLFAFFWQSDQFFRYAFVPLVEDRVTVEGYTMFSAAHLLDVANLLLVLVPGLVVLVVALFQARPRMSRRDLRFGLILVASCVGAAFIFDPKLGMPRDWDLFAFCGVPTAVVWYYLVLTSAPSRLARTAVVCSIGLALTVLGGRVATQQFDDIAAARFERYAALDARKNMNFRKLVVDYYERTGDIERASKSLAAFHEAYPEWNLNRRGMYFMDRKNPSAAIPLYRQAIEHNPVFTAAYSNLAIAYLRQGQLDSAQTMAHIARGFNPLGPRIAVTLGQIALRREQLGLAEQYFDEARQRAPDDVDPVIGLAMVARMRGDEAAYSDHMVQTLRFDTIPVAPLRGFANYLAGRGRYAAAVRVYEKALANGLDSAIYESLLETTPGLKRAADSLAGN